MGLLSLGGCKYYPPIFILFTDYTWVRWSPFYLPLWDILLPGLNDLSDFAGAGDLTFCLCLVVNFHHLDASASLVEGKSATHKYKYMTRIDLMMYMFFSVSFIVINCIAVLSLITCLLFKWFLTKSLLATKHVELPHGLYQATSLSIMNSSAWPGFESLWCCCHFYFLNLVTMFILF